MTWTSNPWISNLSPATAWVLPALAGIILSIIGCALHFWHENRKSELQAETEQEALALKRAMVERGMSAAEIERVLKAGRANEMGTAKT